MDRQASAYLRQGLRRVEGWLERPSAEIVASLGEIQQRLGVAGGVAEIGVHHGKLFNLLQQAEASVAVDIFTQQHLNADGSGRGDLEVFRRNLRRHGRHPERACIIEKSSLALSPHEILAAAGTIRLFSVDGGHTAECTLNDLRIAEQVLAAGGVVLLDDVFNAEWPGVVTGFAAYMALPDRRLEPFAMSPNKVYLAMPEIAPTYRAHLRRAHPVRVVRIQTLFGSTVDQYDLAVRTGDQVRAVARFLLPPPLHAALRAAYRRCIGRAP